MPFKSLNHAKKCTNKLESAKKASLTSSPIPAPEVAPSSIRFFLVLRNSWIVNTRSDRLHQQHGFLFPFFFKAFEHSFPLIPTGSSAQHSPHTILHAFLIGVFLQSLSLLLFLSTHLQVFLSRMRV